MSDLEIIGFIRQGNHAKALDRLYHNFPAFKNSFKKSGGNSSDAGDIFQEALLILIEKLSDKNFKLSCSINSYLFAVCRNLSYEYFRAKGKTASLEFGTEDTGYEIDSSEAFLEKEKQYKALDSILMRIGKKCMEILSLFYQKGLSMTEVAIKLGFKSETSAKTQKYKCIEKARNLTESVMSELQTGLS